MTFRTPAARVKPYRLCRLFTRGLPLPDTQIALISTDGSAETPRSLFEPIAAAWLHRYGVAPTLIPVTPENLLLPAEAKKASQWSAAVLAPLCHPLSPKILMVLDVLAQAMLPTLGLATTPDSRLSSFEPGALFVRGASDDPAETACILATLCTRQDAVRNLDQSLRLTQSFQGEAAAEIDRLHQELLLAAKVQRDFMPKEMPRVPGLECSVLFRPAGFVSGDTYDVTVIDERYVSFFLADAMGHGVPAALMTLYIDGSLPRSEATPDGYRIVQPAEAISRLNQELCESSAGPTRFVTAVYGLVDLELGTITLAVAGHPPPLRVGPHGVRPVDVGGMLLGVMCDYEYEQTTFRLDEDELLVLYSDGVEAAFAPKINPEEKAERLKDPSQLPTTLALFEHMRAMRRGPALENLSSAMDALARELDQQLGSFHQEDDVSVLSLQMLPRRAPLAPPPASAPAPAVAEPEATDALLSR